MLLRACSDEAMGEVENARVCKTHPGKGHPQSKHILASTPSLRSQLPIMLLSEQARWGRGQAGVWCSV